MVRDYHFILIRINLGRSLSIILHSINKYLIINRRVQIDPAHYKVMVRTIE